jgi:hypothetical protein
VICGVGNAGKLRKLLEKIKDQQNAEIMEVLYSWIEGNYLKGYYDFSWYGRKHDGRE